jgi:flagella basal body P-ring formation protein FlgA
MRRATRTLLTSWLILSGTAGSPTPCIADTAVTLKQDVEISRPAVRLGDLFAGVPSGIDRDIAQAPPPCKPALYDEAVLKKLAQTYRLDWQGLGNDRIAVSTACTHISSDTIREAVVARMKTDVDARKLNYEIAFDRRGLEVDLPVKDGPGFTLENFSFDLTSKQFHADLTAQTPRGPFIVPVSGRVSIKRTVPVLARRLEGGTLIGTNDLDSIELAEERITADVVTEPSQLIGRELRRDTPEGNILRARDVMPARLVQRGSLVTMKIETPYILVTAQGKAQQDGAEGETIRVINTQSNRLVEGVVTAPGVVEIALAQKVAVAE